jgi:hypothetical protein
VDGDDGGVAVVEGRRGDERREEGAHVGLAWRRSVRWGSPGAVNGGDTEEANARGGKGSNYRGSVSFVF